jgi:hypothetical protein
MYRVDYDRADTHVPANPERTAAGQTNPFCVYYREFRTRPEMERWLNRQPCVQRQIWHSWMSREHNRRLLAQKKALIARPAEQPDTQLSLFA